MSIMSEKLEAGLIVACWLIHAFMWFWAVLLLLREADNDRNDKEGEE